jgi:hypothetical protein
MYSSRYCCIYLNCNSKTGSSFKIAIRFEAVWSLKIEKKIKIECALFVDLDGPPLSLLPLARSWGFGGIWRVDGSI